MLLFVFVYLFFVVVAPLSRGTWWVTVPRAKRQWSINRAKLCEDHRQEEAGEDEVHEEGCERNGDGSTKFCMDKSGMKMTKYARKNVRK